MESQNVEGPWGRSMKKDKNNKREKKETLTSLPSSVQREGWELLIISLTISLFEFFFSLFEFYILHKRPGK